LTESPVLQVDLQGVAGSGSAELPPLLQGVRLSLLA
jgi:hypothetical protein